MLKVASIKTNKATKSNWAVYAQLVAICTRRTINTLNGKEDAAIDLTSATS